MAASEDICWEALTKAHGESVSGDWLKAGDQGERLIKNAIPIRVLESNLLLHHNRTDVEDSLQFLETRGYLVLHGSRGFSRCAYSLSEAAITVLELGLFPEEEQKAFGEP